MKRKALIIIMALSLLLYAVASVSAQKNKQKDKDNEPENGEQVERSVAASPNVVLSVCLASGDIQVHGWDRPEVKVTATSARQLELQGGGLNPPRRIEVLAANEARGAVETPLTSDCRATTDLDISVPRGATVDIRLRSGDISVSNVAEARIKNMSGDLQLDNITRAIEAETLSGDISVTNSQGRVRISTVSGDIDATNIQTVEASDDFSAHSTSGDINVENVSQSRLSAGTTSGMITMTGKLAPRGGYELNTFSGDVVLNIPQDSAFQINAKAPQGGITTDFAIKSTNEAEAANLLEKGILSGSYGRGDWASLSIQSFSGTVRLQKR
jgi:hypothetical protein